MFRYDPSLKEIVQKQLEGRGTRQGPSERPLTTVKGTALVDLIFRAEVEGHSFISDERESSGSHNAGPAPLRYFLASIMFCHKVWTVKSAALADVKIDRLESEISGYNDPSRDRPGFARIVYKLFIDSKQSDHDMQDVVDGGARRCGLFRAISHLTPIEVGVEHNGKLIYEKVYDESAVATG